MMHISFDVSPEELKDLKKTIDEMNRQSRADLKLQVFRLASSQGGVVNIQLNENRGAEGLEMLIMLLRRLERFQKPSWP